MRDFQRGEVDVLGVMFGEAGMISAAQETAMMMYQRLETCEVQLEKPK